MPTRFLVQEGVYDRFVTRFVEGASVVKVGDGFNLASTMGALANDRRVAAIEELVQDARAQGARIATGGSRVGNEDCFFEPTVITDISTSARAMNEEPFGRSR